MLTPFGRGPSTPELSTRIANPEGGRNQLAAATRARCSANAWLLWVSSKSSW